MDLPDGFVSNKCQQNSDCEDSDPCTRDSCLAATCMNIAKDCSGASDECNVGACDHKTGMCDPVPSNEGGACTIVNSGDPGTCIAGTCAPPPQCVATRQASCRFPTGTLTMTGPSAIQDYACATGETGAEIGMHFRSDLVTRPITLHITGAASDADVFVLNGEECTAGSACVTSSTTAGAGEKILTFEAIGDQQYTIAVEGRNGTTGSVSYQFDCARCTPGPTLACNQTIAGDTTTGVAALHDYACGADYPGPELTYVIAPGTQLYSLKLTGMTDDLDLLVLGAESGNCAPGTCRGYSTSIGTGDEILSIAAASSETRYAVVESKGAGGPFQLEVDCPPSCRNGQNQLNCVAQTYVGRSDAAVRSADVVDAWACDADTTGNEVVFEFSPSASGDYAANLTGLDADLDLIVIEGSMFSCNPLASCVTSSIHAGSTDESVTFTADVNKQYYVIVDGKSGAAGHYMLTIAGVNCPASGACSYNGAPALTCANPSVTGNNVAPGATGNVTSWCGGGLVAGGSEFVHLFQPTTTGTYSFSLSGLSADLDLAVFETPSPTVCNPSTQCLTRGIRTGIQTETVTFDAEAGRSYFLAVDNTTFQSSNYTLAITAGCP